MSDTEQRTEAWFAARCGRITASRFKDAIDIPEDAGQPYKSGPRKGQPRPRSSQARDTYMREIVFERRSQQSVHQIGGRSLTWGTEVEPYIWEAFELQTGLMVRPGGFVTHEKYPFLGASPDALISSTAGGESKAPYSEAVHLQTILNGMPEDHVDQVQGGMLVTGLQGWYFCSYDPRQAEADRLYIQYVKRDERYIQEVLLPGLLQFEAEVQQLMKQLDRRPVLVGMAA